MSLETMDLRTYLILKKGKVQKRGCEAHTRGIKEVRDGMFRVLGISREQSFEETSFSILFMDLLLKDKALFMPESALDREL